MTLRTRPTWTATVLFCLLVLASVATAPTSRAADITLVRIDTPLGSFEIELFPGVAPVTVANFLKYINDGDFTDTFVHRSVSGFVIQGGGYIINDDLTTRAVPADPAIQNEFNLSNVRGTIAMAKLDGNPNSATSQWFINVGNNTELDTQNGGFTVFGEVTAGGMAVVDAIASTPVYNAGGVLAELPLINYTAGSAVLRENLILTAFSVLSGNTPAVIAPLLLRNAQSHSWFSYTLGFENGAAVIDQKGSVALPEDGAFTTVSRGDFDGDGKADVLLRATGSARVAGAGTRAAEGEWFMATLDGKAVTSEGAVAMTADVDFEVVAADDFDGDGQSDLLLRNAVDGSWLLYRLVVQAIRSEVPLALGTTRADQAIGTSDFNDDGRSDILVRRANGTWQLYATNTRLGFTVSTPKLARSKKYEFEALADFDGDGLTDVLLRKNKGGWLLYLLDGKKVRKKGKPSLSADTDFALLASADFNGDGKADALLRNAQDGSWILYTLDGPKVLRQGDLALTSDLDYQVVSVTDFSGDGKADVLLRNTRDGRWLLYAIDGDGPSVLGMDEPRMNESLDWVPQLD